MNPNAHTYIDGVHVFKVLHLPPKIQVMFWKPCQKQCACHAKWLSTLSQTRKVPRLPRHRNLFWYHQKCFAAFPTGTASQKARYKTCLKRCACPARWTWRSPKPAAKSAMHLLKTRLKDQPVTQNDVLIPDETCLNVTQCHTCRTKRSYATFETSKNEHNHKPAPMMGVTAFWWGF